MKLFFSTLGLVFIAELGDKTQLATLSLAASGRSKLTVFAGAATALVLTSAIAAVAGEALTKWVPAIWVTRAAGVAFLVMGGVLLLGRD